MAFPANVDSGRIVGRFIFGVVDGPDADEEPDFAAAVGTITFTPSVKYIPVHGNVEEPFVLVPATITGVLDENGYLCTPNPDDPLMAGYRGIKMVATDDPNFLVQDWTWQVTYKLESRPDAPASIPSHSITVPGGSIQDLSILTQVPSNPGYGLPHAEAAARRAEAAAQSVVDRADSGEFKGDPGNATIRVDNTAGRAIYTWDDTASREQMIYGDTGERDITALLSPAPVSGKLVLARTNNSVQLEFRDLVLQAEASTFALYRGVLPSGFRAGGYFLFFVTVTLGSADKPSAVRISNAGDLTVYKVAANLSQLGTFTWRTPDPWPTTLPGVAA